jgi:outer membrane protein assembly factor BamB
VSRVGRKFLFLTLLALLFMLSGGTLYSQLGLRLVPLSISLKPPPPVNKGTIVTLTTVVENQGTEPVGFPSHKITVQFSYLGTEVSGTLPPVSKETISLDPCCRESSRATFETALDTLAPEPGKPPLREGTYRIFVQVFVTDKITNVTTPTATISTPSAGPNLVILPGEPKPDLLVSAISFTPGSVVGKGERTLFITATVRNSGTMDVESSEVEFSYRLRGESRFRNLGSFSTAKIPRGEERAPSITEDVSTWPAGVYIIRAEVDPQNRQRELNEGNNTADEQLFIIDSSRVKWIYPSFPIPLEKVEDEKPIGAIASGVAITTVKEGGQDKTIIYFGSNDGYLYALNADGTERWKHLTQGAVTTTPVVAQNRIYFGSDDGHLYALSSEGSFAWHYPASGAIGAVKAAPALLKDSSGAVQAIYFGSDDGNLYALNPDGSLRWKFATGAFVRTTPAIGPDGTIYFGSGDGNLYALEDQGDRALLRRTFSTGSFIKSSPVVLNETVYFGSSDGHLYALFLDGTKKWQYPLAGETKCVPPIGAVEAAPLVALEGGVPVIYFGSTNGGLCKVEDRGNEALGQWQFKEYNGIPVGPIRSTPIRRGEMIYFGSDDGNLYAVQDRGSTVSDEWVFPTRGMITGTPAIDGNTLYLPSWEGHLYALKLE